LVRSEKGRIGIINLFASFVCAAAMEELARVFPPDRIGKDAYHLYEKFSPKCQKDYKDEVPKAFWTWI
jgi:hypothetical protein